MVDFSRNPLHSHPCVCVRVRVSVEICENSSPFLPHKLVPAGRPGAEMCLGTPGVPISPRCSESQVQPQGI